MAFAQLRKFQLAALRFRRILADNRRAEVPFSLAFERALGSLDSNERRKWHELFLEHRGDWEEAYLRRSDLSELLEELVDAGMLRR